MVGGVSGLAGLALADAVDALTLRSGPRWSDADLQVDRRHKN
jgi:hypothetical protein